MASSPQINVIHPIWGSDAPREPTRFCLFNADYFHSRPGMQVFLWECQRLWACPDFRGEHKMFPF
jgi:hypothetical protein